MTFTEFLKSAQLPKVHPCGSTRTTRNSRKVDLKGRKSLVEAFGDLKGLERVLWQISRFVGWEEGLQRERRSKKIELSKTQQNNEEEKKQHVVWGCRVL